MSEVVVPPPVENDVWRISLTWLPPCTACDTGTGEHMHPTTGYRQVIADLVEEVERLREAQWCEW